VHARRHALERLRQREPSRDRIEPDHRLGGDRDGLGPLADLRRQRSEHQALLRPGARLGVTHPVVVLDQRMGLDEEGLTTRARAVNDAGHAVTTASSRQRPALDRQHHPAFALGVEAIRERGCDVLAGDEALGRGGEVAAGLAGGVARLLQAGARGIGQTRLVPG